MVVGATTYAVCSEKPRTRVRLRHSAGEDVEDGEVVASSNEGDELLSVNGDDGKKSVNDTAVDSGGGAGEGAAALAGAFAAATEASGIVPDGV